MSHSYKNSYKVQSKEMMSLSVYNVGYQKCEPCYQWGPGIRDHYLIHHIVSGQGYYCLNGETYHLVAGDTFLVYPFSEITYYADENDPWEYYWVGFAGSDAATILRATDFTKEYPVLHSTSFDDEVRKHLLTIYEARGNSLEHAVSMTGLLYSTLALFIRNSSQPAKRQDSYSSYAQKGMEYIHYHYSYPISVEDIAEYAGISRSHLFRSFQSVLGMSPKEYLSNYRIRQSCILLAQSDLSITAIAKSVGFENNLYFSKAFHKIKGMSPSSYAKMKASEQADKTE